MCGRDCSNNWLKDWELTEKSRRTIILNIKEIIVNQDFTATIYYLRYVAPIVPTHKKIHEIWQFSTDIKPLMEFTQNTNGIRYYQENLNQ